MYFLFTHIFLILHRGLLQIWWYSSYYECRILALSSFIPALLNICLLTALILFTVPSSNPLLKGISIAACTASQSFFNTICKVRQCHVTCCIRFFNLFSNILIISIPIDHISEIRTYV